MLIFPKLSKFFIPTPIKQHEKRPAVADPMSHFSSLATIPFNYHFLFLNLLLDPQDSHEGQFLIRLSDAPTKGSP